MRPADSHDHSLMVYADWLYDNDRVKESERVRDGIENHPENPWQYEWSGVGGGVGVAGGGVGGGGVGGF